MQQLLDARIDVSIFVDPDLEQIRQCHKLRAPKIEINTGKFAGRVEAAATGPRSWTRSPPPRAPRRSSAWSSSPATDSPTATSTRIATIPEIEELNIGHSIISRAALVGTGGAVREMVALMRARGDCRLSVWRPKRRTTVLRFLTSLRLHTPSPQLRDLVIRRVARRTSPPRTARSAARAPRRRPDVASRSSRSASSIVIAGPTSIPCAARYDGEQVEQRRRRRRTRGTPRRDRDDGRQQHPDLAREHVPRVGRKRCCAALPATAPAQVITSVKSVIWSPRPNVRT